MGNKNIVATSFTSIPHDQGYIENQTASCMMTIEDYSEPKRDIGYWGGGYLLAVSFITLKDTLIDTPDGFHYYHALAK